MDQGKSFLLFQQCLTISQMTDFRLFHFKLNKFANNFKFEKKKKKAKQFSKWVENTVEERKIACNKQFLLFKQSFPKAGTTDTCKPGPVWEKVKSICRQQIQCGSNCSIFLQEGIKYRATRKKCYLIPTFSILPTMYKSLFPWVV